jgi:23S rRNA (cytidine1920-2'-O)/16S rRNA (cytidine1409-2'-O)-methyltransferase
MKYVSRAGEKLEFALNTFNISLKDFVCADFGSNVGGFVDCLLQHGARKVFAVETGKGILDWKLRQDKRVNVLEKTNAMHVILPEKMDFISTDTSWTKLGKVLPNIILNLKKEGEIVALVKPHYEAEQKMLRKGKLSEEYIGEILSKIRKEIMGLNLEIFSEVMSPIAGKSDKKTKNFYFILESSNFLFTSYKLLATIYYSYGTLGG